MDLATVQALNQWQPQIDQVLTQDDEYRLSENTAAFSALQKQIKDVNTGLAKLQSQISSIASHFAMAGEVIAAIDKVLSLIP
jgi:septal ring factor EnvC (AmiA/AmiB activator)